MHWWPRHTPRVGVVSPKWRTTSLEMPAFSGVDGPGEMTIFSGAMRVISSTVVSSFLYTCTSAPSSHRYWYRL